MTFARQGKGLRERDIRVLILYCIPPNPRPHSNLNPWKGMYRINRTGKNISHEKWYSVGCDKVLGGVDRIWEDLLPTLRPPEDCPLDQDKRYSDKKKKKAGTVLLLQGGQLCVFHYYIGSFVSYTQSKRTIVDGELNIRTIWWNSLELCYNLSI